MHVGMLLFPTPFIKKSIFTLLNYLGTHVKFVFGVAILFH